MTSSYFDFMLKRNLINLYRLAPYTFAVVILSAAVLVTVVRLALPGIGAHKQTIESWLSDYMSYRVTIQNIRAEWQNWQPYLYVDGLDVYHQDSDQLISQFDAQIRIAPFASLMRFEVVPDYLSVSGFELELIRDIDGSIAISRTEQNDLHNMQQQGDFSEWLLKQKYIIFEDVTLSWHDKKHTEAPLHFSNARLELKTAKERLQIEIAMLLPEQYGQSIKIKMDIIGDILTADWGGTVYFEARKVKPRAFFKEPLIANWGGTSDLKLWTKWDGSRLRDFDAILDRADFFFNSDTVELPIQLLEAKLYGERQHNKDWSIQFQTDSLTIRDQHWPRLDYHINIAKNETENRYHYNAHLSYLRLQELLPVLIESKVLPTDLMTQLRGKEIQGELLNIAFSHDLLSTLSAQFKNLAIRDQTSHFSVTNLAGSLQLNDPVIQVQLDSQDTKINIHSLYEPPLLLASMESDLEIDYGMNTIFIIRDLNIIAAGAAIKTVGQVTISDDSTLADFKMVIENLNVAAVSQLVPKHLDLELHEWLATALVDGEIISGDLSYRGDFADFPFADGAGQFKAVLNVSDATLYYDEHWPPLEQLTATVIFENDQVLIQSNSGRFFDVQVDTVQAKINNISAAETLHVLVDGTLSGHSRDAARFITQSPLGEDLQLVESTKTISGQLGLKLKLDIPLSPEKSTVEGTLSLLETTIVSDFGLALEKVHGNIEFNNENFWATGLRALYRDRPVTLSIPRLVKETDSTHFILSGKADHMFIAAQLNDFLSSKITHDDLKKYFNGESEWRLTIRPHQVGQIKTQSLELVSDLIGMDLNLPYPLGKSTDQAKPIKIKTTLKNSLIEQIDIDYGSLLYATMLVDNRQDFIVKQTLIGLGRNAILEESNVDVAIQGELERLDLSQWLAFIDQHPSSQQARAKLFSGNILVQQLNLFGYDFNAVNIDFNNQNNLFTLAFDSERLKGISRFLNGQKDELNSLNMDFEKIMIEQAQTLPDKLHTITLEDLPVLKINIDQAIYQERDFGKVTLLTNPIDGGIDIKTFRLDSPALSMDASGQWLQVDGLDKSMFKVELSSESLDKILTTFGYDKSNIESSKTNITLQASWLESPLNFALEKIDGVLDVNIGRGQFLNIESSPTGRMLGLFSVQSLFRTVLLDFTDLFNEGLTFDSVKGRFNVQQGIAHIDHLEMRSSSANIMMTGSIGLITEDYDQIATVTPKVSSTLPVASAFLGPVGVGVGAAIYLAGEFFEFIPAQIDRLLSYQYSIKGSWDAPVVTKLKTPKSDGG